MMMMMVMVVLAGIQLESLSCESVMACLEALERHGDEEWLPRIARSLLTRALAEANYVSANELELAKLRHFGLGVPLYTHFTYSTIPNKPCFGTISL